MKCKNQFKNKKTGIRFNNLIHLGPHRSIGVVFQEESTFPWRTVQENVEFGLQMQGVPKAEYKERASKMIDLVGLKGFGNSYP